MVRQEYPVTFSLIPEKGGKYKGELFIDQSLTSVLYNQIISTHQAETYTQGFSKGNTPRSYIEENYKIPIHQHLQEFVFFHCVINAIYYQIHKEKLLLVGDPHLSKICSTDTLDLSFEFNFTLAQPVFQQSWKSILFKPAQRKNYKDLDRQVEHFLTEEEQIAIRNKSHEGIQVGDWICFTMTLVDNKHPEKEQYANELWLRIGEEDVDIEARTLFIGKNSGDSFYSDSIFFQHYVSTQLDSHYLFLITIKDRVSTHNFSFDLFKKHFRLRSFKEMHLKFIEVFSFRNDISQRRETVEALFKVLSNYVSCSIPAELIEVQKKKVLKDVHANPDYHVYKAFTNFEENIKKLAEKQLKQALIIDYINFQESIELVPADILSYLYLTQRSRTKEFLYFTLPETKIHGQEQPVPVEIIKRYCLREKTLNYMLYYLAKKN